jgi:hypothetical protein
LVERFMGAHTGAFILSLAAVLLGAANVRAEAVEDRVRLTLDRRAGV